MSVWDYVRMEQGHDRVVEKRNIWVDGFSALYYLQIGFAWGLRYCICFLCETSRYEFCSSDFTCVFVGEGKQVLCLNWEGKKVIKYPYPLNKNYSICFPECESLKTSRNVQHTLFLCTELLLHNNLRQQSRLFFKFCTVVVNYCKWRSPEAVTTNQVVLEAQQTGL